MLEPGAARGIRLVEQLAFLIGSVAAGSPCSGKSVGSRATQQRLIHATCLLTVRGNSMIGVGILDGDLLAVHRTQDARNGQIVVARIDDEVTVKRLSKRGNKIELLAENPDYAPIPVNGTSTIEGLAVGLIRNGQAL